LLAFLRDKGMFITYKNLYYLLSIKTDIEKFNVLNDIVEALNILYVKL